MKDSSGYTFPVSFQDVHYIASLYASNSVFVHQKLAGTGLKPGLVFNGKPVVALGLIEYKESDLGAYNEVIIAIPVIPENEKSGYSNWLELYAPLKSRKLGQYIIHIPVNSVQSMEAGMELWGYPKTVLGIKHVFSDNKIDSCIYKEDSVQSIIEFSGKLGMGIPIPSMDLMTYSFLNGELLKTKVDVKANMRWNPFADIQIKIKEPLHPICLDLDRFGICNQKPLLTVSSTKFTAKFNEGLKMH